MIFQLQIQPKRLDNDFAFKFLAKNKQIKTMPKAEEI